MSTWEAQARPVNRFPCDSMIRTGRPSHRTRKLPGSARQPRDAASPGARYPAGARPVDVRRIGRADEDVTSRARRLRQSRLARIDRRGPRGRPPERGQPASSEAASSVHIARPKALRRSSRGEARPATRPATAAGRGRPRTGPTARERRPRASARRTGPAGRRPRRAAWLPVAGLADRDATSAPRAAPRATASAGCGASRPARRADAASESACRVDSDPCRTGSKRSFVTSPRPTRPLRAPRTRDGSMPPSRARSVAKLAPCRSSSSSTSCSSCGEIHRRGLARQLARKVAGRKATRGSSRAAGFRPPEPGPASEQVVEPGRAVVLDTSRQDVAFPHACRCRESLQLLEDQLERTPAPRRVSAG